MDVLRVRWRLRRPRPLVRLRVSRLRLAYAPALVIASAGRSTAVSAPTQSNIPGRSEREAFEPAAPAGGDGGSRHRARGTEPSPDTLKSSAASPLSAPAKRDPSSAERAQHVRPPKKKGPGCGSGAFSRFRGAYSLRIGAPAAAAQSGFPVSLGCGDAPPANPPSVRLGCKVIRTIRPVPGGVK